MAFVSDHRTPGNEKPRPKAAIFHITFPFFMKFAKSRGWFQKIAANLLVPRAAWGRNSGNQQRGQQDEPPAAGNAVDEDRR